MTLDELRALADKFFEWPEGSGRQTVTTFSALLFAQHVLKLREMHEKHEKSLGTENNAGMDALRDAAQRQLDALGGYRREIGLLTGVPDEQPCDAEVALRAALEQEQNLRILLRDIRNDEQCFHWQESIDAELGGEP